MCILGSVEVSVLLESNLRVRNVVVRVEEDLPNSFSFGAEYFRSNGSTLAFTHDKGYRPAPSARPTLHS